MNLDEEPSERRQSRTSFLLDWVPFVAGGAVVVGWSLWCRSWVVFGLSSAAYALALWLDRKYCVLTTLPILAALPVLRVVRWVQDCRERRRGR